MTTTSGTIAVGTAGWALRTDVQGEFEGDGTHLARYARRFGGVEINSSFYRPHRRTTYERWAASVPPAFRFAVKVPRTITHELRLRSAETQIERFLDEVAGLGDRLGPLLVQLPPSLAFDEGAAQGFLHALRTRHGGQVVLEARHPTWFGERAEALLRLHDVAGVAADPAPVPAAAEPRGSRSLVYVRLHGSPVIYRSRYDTARVHGVATTLAEAAADGADAWCIFDNTADGFATVNALELMDALRRVSAARPATAAGGRSPSS